MRVRVSPWWVIGLLVAVPATGVATLALVASDTPAELVVAPQPVLIEPTERITDGRVEGMLTLQFGDPTQVRSTGAQGVVTGLRAEPGAELRAGDPVLEVDGIERLLMVAQSPLYRTLTMGAEGPDVLALEEHLMAVGVLDEEPDEIYDAATTVAVEDYEEQIGVRLPSGDFSPDLVVWAPAEPVAVGQFAVLVGDPAPPVGQPILLGPPPVTRAVLSSTAGGVLQFDGPRVLELNGEVLGEVEDPWRVPDELVRIVTARADSEGGEGQEEGIPVVLRFAEPRSALTVPTSAVMVSSSGTGTCVWVLDGQVFEASTVDVLGGELGTTEVDGDIEGEQVLVNPSTVLGEPTCPSS